MGNSTSSEHVKLETVEKDDLPSLQDSKKRARNFFKHAKELKNSDNFTEENAKLLISKYLERSVTVRSLMFGINIEPYKNYIMFCIDYGNMDPNIIHTYFT